MRTLSRSVDRATTLGEAADFLAKLGNLSRTVTNSVEHRAHSLCDDGGSFEALARRLLYWSSFLYGTDSRNRSRSLNKKVLVGGENGLVASGNELRANGATSITPNEVITRANWARGGVGVGRLYCHILARLFIFKKSKR
jgi:hypothetical protein